MDCKKKKKKKLYSNTFTKEALSSKKLNSRDNYKLVKS